MGADRCDTTRLVISSLERQAQVYLPNGVSANTQKTYSSAQKFYLDFCSRLDLNLMPASESQLILFATELAQSRTESTIRSYISVVRHLHIIHSYENALASKPRLELVLKGIRRIKPKSSVPRLPITPVLLTHI